MERKCGKCKTEEGIVWTTDGARCEDCFCLVTMHSVKTILSRNKLAMFKSRICVSSNPPSTSSAALMAVLDECLKPGPKRKASRMSFEVIVLHVRLPMELFGSGEKGKVRVTIVLLLTAADGDEPMLLTTPRFSNGPWIIGGSY